MRCQVCGTMNEPGFRFCGSCGARQDPAVSAAVGAPAAGMAPEGFGEPARRSAAMSVESMGLSRRSRTPLAVLLIVDAALAIAGGLLLRAGLARPAAAAAGDEGQAPGSAGSESAARSGNSSTEPAAVVAPGAAKEKPAAADNGSGGAVASGSAAADPTDADPAAAAAASPGGQPARNLVAGASGSASEPKASDSLDGGAAKPDTSGKGSKPDKGDKELPRRTVGDRKPGGAGEGPVDPYAPPAPPPAAASADEQRKLLLAAFTRAQPKFNDCYNKVARGVGPTELTVSFQVMVDGSLGGARFLDNQPGGEILGACVIAELGKMKIKSGSSTELIRRIKFKTK